MHDVYVGAGYRAAEVRRQAGGGTGLTDIYLANIGNQVSTATAPPTRGSGSASGPPGLLRARQRLRASEFPTNTPLENMQVTAAHEYFHAVQYAYDATEASWFMEATATWAEDEVYDSVNDNVNYLRAGQLGLPDLSLDREVQQRERLRELDLLPLPDREVRRVAGRDAEAGPRHVAACRRLCPGPTSTASRPWSNTVKAAGGDFAKAVRRVRRRQPPPAKAYDEGAAQRYPTAPAGTSGP